MKTLRSVLYDGERVSLEADLYPSDVATVKLFDPVTDIVFVIGKIDPRSDIARKRLEKALPERLRGQAHQLLLRLADEAMNLPDVEPQAEPELVAADPVNGATVANSIAATYLTYLVLPEKHHAHVLAAWVLFAHAHDAFSFSPLLIFTSPTRGSAKTRSLEVTQQLVPRPWMTVNPSNAALFRSIEKDHPTLLWDEADSINWTERQESLGMLNAGFSRSGATVRRCVGEGANVTMKDFSVWCPKALATIKLRWLPDTTLSRAVVLKLQRKLRNQSVRRFREKAARAELAPIKEQAARWAQDHRAELEAATPTMPLALSDRAADAWEPLFAVAGILGGKWPARILAAALALTSAGDAMDPGEELLADLRRIWPTDAKKAPEKKVASADLVERLKGLEGGLWAEWNKGKGLTANGLARLLSPFSIGPRNVKIDGAVPKGYHYVQFDDAWRGYLPAPAQGDSNRYPATDGATKGDTPPSEPLPVSEPVAVENAPNSFDATTSSGVAVEIPPDQDGDGTPTMDGVWKVTP